MKRKTGLLLVNLGTPHSPKPKDVFRYLIEFLTDSRVITLPWLLRQFLVRVLIVPKRYRQSAKSYSEIWQDKGSPLMVHSKSLEKILKNDLDEEYNVALAMRYQSPSIEEALDKLLSKPTKELIILPLFPQYASATTGSIQEKVLQLLSKRQVIPKLTFINQFATDEHFIEAVSTIALSYPLESYDHFLFSFHGLPESHVKAANPFCKKDKECCQKICHQNEDCYAAQCYKTAEAIAKKLKLNKESYSISFQSRLGKEPWLEPFTQDSIKQLAHAGKKKVLVFCPSFVADCLETLHEIGIEYKAEFINEGGHTLDFVRGLNDHPKWIEALKKIVFSHTPKSNF